MSGRVTRSQTAYSVNKAAAFPVNGKRKSGSSSKREQHFTPTTNRPAAESKKIKTTPKRSSTSNETFASAKAAGPATLSKIRSEPSVVIGKDEQNTTEKWSGVMATTKVTRSMARSKTVCLVKESSDSFPLYGKGEKRKTRSSTGSPKESAVSFPVNGKDGKRTTRSKSIRLAKESAVPISVKIAKSPKKSLIQ